MKRLLVIMLLLTAMAVTAGHGYQRVNTLPMENPRFEQHVQQHSFARDKTYRQTLKRIQYQRAQSRYILLRSPYGKRPWNKPIGDMPYQNLYKNDADAFYGFQYDTLYYCDSINKCYRQNVFKD